MTDFPHGWLSQAEVNFFKLLHVIFFKCLGEKLFSVSKEHQSEALFSSKALPGFSSNIRFRNYSCNN